MSKKHVLQIKIRQTFCWGPKDEKVSLYAEEVMRLLEGFWETCVCKEEPREIRVSSGKHGFLIVQLVKNLSAMQETPV